MTNKNFNNIPDRIKYIRTILNLNQSAMASRLKIKQSTLSVIERRKTKTITDRIINDICREFSVSENWLRTGEGEIFIEPSTFSFDDYIKTNNLSPLEVDIIKGYMELDPDTRKQLLEKFKMIFNKHNG